MSGWKIKIIMPRNNKFMGVGNTGMWNFCLLSSVYWATIIFDSNTFHVDMGKKLLYPWYGYGSEKCLEPSSQSSSVIGFLLSWVKAQAQESSSQQLGHLCWDWINSPLTQPFILTHSPPSTYPNTPWKYNFGWK